MNGKKPTNQPEKSVRSIIPRKKQPSVLTQNSAEMPILRSPITESDALVKRIVQLEKNTPSISEFLSLKHEVEEILKSQASLQTENNELRSQLQSTLSIIEELKQKFEDTEWCINQKLHTTPCPHTLCQPTLHETPHLLIDSGSAPTSSCNSDAPLRSSPKNIIGSDTHTTPCPPSLCQTTLHEAPHLLIDSGSAPASSCNSGAPLRSSPKTIIGSDTTSVTNSPKKLDGDAQLVLTNYKNQYKAAKCPACIGKTGVKRQKDGKCGSCGGDVCFSLTIPNLPHDKLIELLKLYREFFKY